MRKKTKMDLATARKLFDIADELGMNLDEKLSLMYSYNRIVEICISHKNRKKRRGFAWPW